MKYYKDITDESKPSERGPRNVSYYSALYATIGNCPRCGARVENGWGHTDKRCKKCNLLLDWEHELEY